MRGRPLHWTLALLVAIALATLVARPTRHGHDLVARAYSVEFGDSEARARARLGVPVRVIARSSGDRMLRFEESEQAVEVTLGPTGVVATWVVPDLRRSETGFGLVTGAPTNPTN